MKQYLKFLSAYCNQEGSFAFNNSYRILSEDKFNYYVKVLTKSSSSFNKIKKSEVYVPKELEGEVFLKVGHSFTEIELTKKRKQNLIDLGLLLTKNK